MSKHCIVCSHVDFNILFDYNDGKVVTSDNKILNQNFQLLECKNCSHIQKSVDADLLETIDKIYSDYEAYYLTSGREEEKFDSNNANTNRSKIIINNLEEILKQNGSILDVGTGSGVFLEEFSKVFNWDLYAQDVKVSKNNNLKRLKNFKNFFIFKQENLYAAYFDIVSAIHVLEHVTEVHTFLASVKKSLKADGFLLLEVPNIYESLFDIFVIDHISHFHKSTIYHLLQKHFKFVYFPEGQINREITVIATDKEMHFAYDNAMQKKEFSSQKINHILHQISSIDEKMALFGTSPNALFCASFLDFKIECFVDENVNKTNKKLFNKSIVHPKDMPTDIKIIFPYSKDIFQNVQKRYPALNFIHIASVL